MSDKDERIAVLESRQARLHEDYTEMMRLFREHMENEDERWETIQNHMSKQKGFVGGVVLVVSSVWAVFLAAAHFLNK